MWSCCCVKAACWSDAPLPRTDINSPMIKARADVVSSARAFPVWGEICLSKSGLWDTQDAKIGLYKRKSQHPALAPAKEESLWQNIKAVNRAAPTAPSSRT